MSNIRENLKRKINEQEQEQNQNKEEEEQNNSNNDTTTTTTTTITTEDNNLNNFNSTYSDINTNEQKSWKEKREDWLEKIKNTRNYLKSFYPESEMKEKTKVLINFDIISHDEYKDNKQKHTKKYLVMHEIAFNENVFQQVQFVEKSMYTNKLEWLEKSTKETVIESLKYKLYNEMINFFSTEEQRERMREND